MIRPHQIIALAALACCAGCGTLGHSIFGPPEAFGGVHADWEAITDGKPCWVLDLPFSAIGDTLVLPLELREQAPRRDPLEGWRYLGSEADASYHPDKVITDDVQRYLVERKVPSSALDGAIAFFEDGTGRHAVRINARFEGNLRRYILFYDKANARTKTMKFIVGRYMNC
jgi:uncharacterized protein YceK